MSRAPRTLVVGDSLGVGTGPGLQRMLSGRVDVDARVGRPSREGVARLRQALARGKYDRVVFDLGTNDGTAQETARSLRQAQRLVGDTPLFVATVNGPDAARKNRAIRASGARVVDWARQGNTGGDGIHATASGYAQRARMFGQEMRRAGSLVDAARPPASPPASALQPPAASTRPTLGTSDLLGMLRPTTPGAPDGATGGQQYMQDILRRLQTLSRP